MSIKIQIIQKNQETLAKDKSFTYYSCNYRNEKRIFIRLPPKDNNIIKNRNIIVWLNSNFSKNGLGWDSINVLDNCNNIEEITEAELKFYV